MNATPRNIISVARREFSVRASTRSFIIGTAFLAIAGVALVLVPIGIRWFEGESTTKVGVVDLADPPTSFDPVMRLSLTLNASAATPEGESGFEVRSSPGEAAARERVVLRVEPAEKMTAIPQRAGHGEGESSRRAAGRPRSRSARRPRDG